MGWSSARAAGVWEVSEIGGEDGRIVQETRSWELSLKPFNLPQPHKQHKEHLSGQFR